MADNEVQEFSFSALATLAQALAVLEIGQIGVVSFGESASVASPLRHAVSPADGAAIMKKFDFAQSSTLFAPLLKSVIGQGGLFSPPQDNSSPASRLLLSE